MIPALDRYWTAMADREDEAGANGWSERSQLIRMAATVALCDPKPGELILDWGCGTGRLLDFLPSGVRYLGVDPCAAMIERAIRERPMNEADFVCNETVPVAAFDHVIALGLWNVRPWDPDQTPNEITALWNVTRKNLVVSLLRTSAREESVTYEPIDVVRWAQRLSPRWSLDAAYLPNDMLVVLER